MTTRRHAVHGGDDGLVEAVDGQRLAAHQRHTVRRTPHAAPPFLPRLVVAEARNRASAFVCRDLACSAPVRDLAEFKKAMA